MTADGEPLFLVRGGTLKTGPVTTAFNGASPLEIGSRLALEGNGRTWYALAAFGNVPPTADLFDMPEVRDYHLVLYRHPGADTGQRQELLQHDQLLYANPSILWAGDLDRDGELDLLLDTTFHYNVTHLSLWLSSAAPEGALMGEVAQLASSGC